MTMIIDLRPSRVHVVLGAGRHDPFRVRRLAGRKGLWLVNRTLFTLLAGGIIAASGALIATPASAATPAEICGSGYGVVDQRTLTGSKVYLLFNNSSGYNCVVTIKTSSVGTKTRTGTYLEVQGQSPLVDANDYAYYAGPTRAYARGKCVKWGGGTNAQWWYSGFSHCG